MISPFSRPRLSPDFIGVWVLIFAVAIALLFLGRLSYREGISFANFADDHTHRQLLSKQLDDAKTAGRWTDAQFHGFIRRLGPLTPKNRRYVLGSLANMINKNELIIEHGPSRPDPVLCPCSPAPCADVPKTDVPPAKTTPQKGVAP